MAARTLLVLAIILLSSCSKEAPQRGGMSIPVVAYEVTPKDLDDLLPLVGSLVAYESVELRSEIAGRVEEIAFEEGSAVQKGQILLKIDAEKLQAQVDEAQANFNLARANLKRSEALLRKRTISQQEQDQAAATHFAAKATLERVNNRLREATVVAPFDGKVGARLISPGAFVQEGDRLSSLVALDPLRVSFEVPEKFLGALSIGQSFSIKVTAYPQRTFQGKIYFISPEVSPNTRTILVKGETPNPQIELKPGMFANISLKIRTFKNALTIPDSSMMLEQDKVFVFRIKKDNSVEKVQITIERILEGEIIVSSGIKAGDTIVAQGFQKLFPGASVSFSS